MINRYLLLNSIIHNSNFPLRARPIASRGGGSVGRKSIEEMLVNVCLYKIQDTYYVIRASQFSVS